MRRMLEFLRSKEGAMLTSVLLGLGLASMFRYTCVGDSCVVVQAPDFEELSRTIYEMDGNCYKYTPSATVCPERQAPST